jgi:excisionase family DNA binding protein
MSSEDVLDRLWRDPMTLTLKEILQDRETAIREITRLRELQLRDLSPARKHSPAADTAQLVRSTRDPAHAAIDSDRFIRLAEVCRLTGLSRSTIYNMLQAGQFPNSVRVGARAVRWRLAAVNAWLGGRERDELSTGAK